MRIIRSNLERLLNYAIAKREEEEAERNRGSDSRSIELAAWKDYLKEVEAGAVAIAITD